MAWKRRVYSLARRASPSLWPGNTEKHSFVMYAYTTSPLARSWLCLRYEQCQIAHEILKFKYKQVRRFLFYNSGLKSKSKSVRESILNKHNVTLFTLFTEG